jgi:hypothetical protein
MGEIATWSAVKTKVGLGKDSNECPTKAELLALSPTGTGENYVGLEISNASSYGNNETVQLSDIHKVTYRYAFTVVDTVLNFPALGGYPTPRWFGLGTTKQKQIDGVAIGDTISVGYTQSAYPDWIVYDEGYKASENTTLNQRSASLTFTQNESGKQITVQFTQDAGVETWEYTFSVQNPNLNYTALGGSATPAIAGYNSFKQRYINGKPVGTSVDVGFSSPDLPSWIFMDDENHYTALENKSENSRSQVFTSTQNESGKKVTVTFAQLAGVKTYGTPTVYLGSIADIPASGGTAATPTYTYSQLWGWNGKTDDGGTISSGASIVWSENISGSNLGTTAKARTKLGSRTLTVTLNGKSGSASIDVYQAENKITNVTQGAWVVSISANPSTFTEQGGTSQISASARASRTNHWSSGATSAASDATGTPTLSIPTAVTGFSLSGTTLTVAENTTANQRSVVVRATMDTVYKEITVTQSAYLVEWQYTFTASPTTLSFDALGTAKSITITSYREKYINGSLVEGSRENVSYIHATSTEHIGTVLGTSISMQENQTTSTRSGQVSYEQNGSNKVIRITCNQAAGTVSTRDVLEVVDNFGDSPAVGGSIFGLVKSGYYDVINGKDSTWHNVTPTLKSKSSYITNVEITKASGDGYNIGITLSENTSESSRRASLTLTYGSKEVDMATTQAGASVAWSYELKVNNGTQDLNQQVPAKPSGTYSFTISSKRYKIVNGSVTSQSEDTTWTTSIPGSPSWIHVEEQSGALIVTLDENTSSSSRSADIIIFQTGSGDTSITLTIEQQAATISYEDYIDYSPSSENDAMVGPEAQTWMPIQIVSYRATIINGKETSKVGVKPTIQISLDESGNWADVEFVAYDSSNYIYTHKIIFEENTGGTRHGSVQFKNGSAELENPFTFTQDAATISTRYEISWTANYSNGTVEENVTEVELEGTTGMENSVRMDLHILEYTSINGVEGTPTSWDSRTIAENNSAIASPSGQVSATLQSDSENAFIGISNSVQNLSEYPRTHTITLYNPKVVINGKEVGTVPTITLLVNPVPYRRIFIFGWKGAGNTNTNIILSGDIMNSDSVASRDIISYASLQRNNVEFAKKYIKPTLIPPSEDWLQVIDNGQNSDNSYNYAIRALTDNDGESARSQSVRFEQPGNGNQALYAYVSQDPRDEGYLGGRVNNNGPRTIRLNTIKDENWVGNIDIRSGNYYGLGTLAQDAITIETNISVGGTDSSTYTQQVELSNLRFSESGRPVTISNDPNQNTDYEYSWELYPNANVPASFTVNISMLSSDGDNDDGIRLDIIKKNTAVFPIGTLIGNLTLTPKDPTKLPILLCAVYHRYFT